MKRILKSLFTKGTLMSRLLRLYATFMIAVTTLATILITWNTFERNEEQAQVTIQDAIQTTNRMITNKRVASRIILNQLTGSYDKLENLTAYVSKPISDYFSYMYSRRKDVQDFFLYPDELTTIYANYDDLKSIYISLTEFPDYLESTLLNKSGVVKKGTPNYREEAFYINMPIVQGGLNGSMLIGFQESDIDSSLRTLNSFGGLSVYVISGSMNDLYSYHDSELDNDGLERQEQILFRALQTNASNPLQNLSEDYYVASEEIDGEYRILVTMEKAAVTKSSLSMMLPLIIGMILLDLSLLYALIRTFKRYSKQVETISETMELASSGKLSARIDLEQTEFELQDLSEGINHMLESIDQYVYDLYKLKIQQQDAHMRALQSQINPHFLYNTLEYIRMYAISEGSEELADVVYAFSSLLRNNISSETTTTLEEELKFCEKYVYLYQMRYPKRVAYHFCIEEEMKNFTIPKFTIQPLIENYFKHGIDFTRKNNGISVKAYRKDEVYVIEVKDNGKGVSKERLLELEERLKNQKPELYDSIGLQNVNERMRAFFGEGYQMKLQQNEGEGLIVLLLLEEGNRNVSRIISR